MTLWLIRAGRTGEREKLALEKSAAILGWEALPDITPCTTRETLTAQITAAYPEEKRKTLMNWESQLWAFRDTIKVGDLVAMPLKSRADIAFGRVTGAYEYRTDFTGTGLHTRSVQWLNEFPRSDFDQDLLYSFGAFMTVCRIERNNAEQRIKAKLDGKKISPQDWGISSQKRNAQAPDILGPSIEISDSSAMPDIEQQSQDLIRNRLAQRFKGHALASLVAAILEAQGYRTNISPPGADGGVDIMAGTGPLGFDVPRLIVQVKSQDAKVDVKVLRELTGVMTTFHADHALLVGWGGFTQPTRSEAASAYFKVRLWDAGDIVKAVQTNYELLPEAIRAELPLKRVWTLVPDDDES